MASSHNINIYSICNPFLIIYDYCCIWQSGKILQPVFVASTGEITKVCFPGAGVREIKDWLATVMSRGAAPTVCFSVGLNEVSKATNKELHRGLKT